MTYEIVSESLGTVSVWTVDATSMREARKTAHEQLNRTVRGKIVGVRPVGYKPTEPTA